MLLKLGPKKMLFVSEGNLYEMLQQMQECLGMQYEQSACGPDQARRKFASSYQEVSWTTCKFCLQEMLESEAQQFLFRGPTQPALGL